MGGGGGLWFRFGWYIGSGIFFVVLLGEKKWRVRCVELVGTRVRCTDRECTEWRLHRADQVSGVRDSGTRGMSRRWVVEGRWKRCRGRCFRT